MATVLQQLAHDIGARTAEACAGMAGPQPSLPAVRLARAEVARLWAQVERELEVAARAAAVLRHAAPGGPAAAAAAAAEGQAAKRVRR
jgi:hypothetical protein